MPQREGRPKPTAVRRIAIVGTGVIGAGWTAHFLAKGYDVTAWDPAPNSESRLQHAVDIAWSALEDLGLPEAASRERLHFANSLSNAVAEADFVQENGPERLELKQQLLNDIDAVAPIDIVVASSTSGYEMTALQKLTSHPDRFVVGHPFNPPYLIPLVEVVGGQHTEQSAVDWAAAFYEQTGHTTIKLKREVPGFVADRLQEAMWREALHMVANDEATVEEIDAAVVHGPGLRWAVMGPCLTFHLAGGDGGMADFLDHFGPPSLEAAWTRLPAPDLTAELRDRMIAGAERIAAGRTAEELVRWRDQCLIGILRARRRFESTADR